MAQLGDKRIKFNGYDLFARFGVRPVSINTGEELMVGINRSSVRDDLNTMVGFNENITTLTIELVKFNGLTNDPIAFDKYELDELLRLLYSTNEVSKLENDGVTYYGAFVNNGTGRYYGDVEALQLEFELASPYAYVDGYVDKLFINGTREVPIMNLSNANKPVFIDIDIINNSTSSGNITIENPLTDKKLVINNIYAREEVYVTGDTSELYSLTTPDRNLYPSMSGEFIDLAYGRNKIKITTTKEMIITIHFQLIKIIQ